MAKKEPLECRQRKYIRLDSVFPVEFRILSLDGKNFLSDWLQGFTRNISRGGLCLEVNNLATGLVELIRNYRAKLCLKIEMPIVKNPVSAIAAIIWIKDIADTPNRYLLGLNYEEIDSRQNNKIMYYAYAKKLFIPVALISISLLVTGLVIGSYINMKLIRSNRAIVEQLVKIIQESSIAKQKIKEITNERQQLELKIKALELRIKIAEKEKTTLEKKVKSEAYPSYL